MPPERSGAEGICRRRAPVVSNTAFPTAAAISVMDVLPAPVASSSGWFNSYAFHFGNTEKEIEFSALTRAEPQLGGKRPTAISSPRPFRRAPLSKKPLRCLGRLLGFAGSLRGGASLHPFCSQPQKAFIRSACCLPWAAFELATLLLLLLRGLRFSNSQRKATPTT